MQNKQKRFLIQTGESFPRNLGKKLGMSISEALDLLADLRVLAPISNDDISKGLNP